MTAKQEADLIAQNAKSLPSTWPNRDRVSYMLLSPKPNGDVPYFRRLPPYRSGLCKFRVFSSRLKLKNFRVVLRLDNNVWTLGFVIPIGGSTMACSEEDKRYPQSRYARILIPNIQHLLRHDVELRSTDHADFFPFGRFRQLIQTIRLLLQIFNSPTHQQGIPEGQVPIHGHYYRVAACPWSSRSSLLTNSEVFPFVRPLVLVSTPPPSSHVVYSRLHCGGNAHLSNGPHRQMLPYILPRLV